MRITPVVLLLNIAIAVSSFCADEAASVEAWLGKSGKLTRSTTGQVESVTLYGERPMAIGQDKATLVPRRFTDDDLARLAGLSDLKKLELDGFMDIRGPGFAKLADLKNLAVLVTQNPVFTEEGLAALGTVKSLRSVSLGHTKTDLAGASKLLAALPNLEEFAPSVFATDIMLAAVGQRPSLKKMAFGSHWVPIGDPTLTIGGYQNLLKLPVLTDLVIEVLPEDPHPRATIEILSKLKKLKKLQLAFGDRMKGKGVLSKEDLAPLLQLPELENLRLMGDHLPYTMEPGAISILKGCPNLKWLFVHHTTVAESEFEALKKDRPTLKLQYIQDTLKPKIQSW